MKISSLFFVVCISLSGCAGPKDNSRPSPQSSIDSAPKVDSRLASVKKIYIDSLGNEEGSDLVREKIRKLLVESDRFTVVESPDRSDAILTGVAGVERTYHSSVYSVNGQVYGGGNTHFKGVGMFRLVDTKDEEQIWFFEYETRFGFSSASGRVAGNVVDKLLADTTIADKNASVIQKVVP